LVVSLVAMSAAAVLVVLAPLADGDANVPEALFEGLWPLLVGYGACVLVLAAAHTRLRHRRGVGRATFPHPAGLVALGVPGGALAYGDAGTVSGAVQGGVAGMAIAWVIDVVVRSRIGSRRLAGEFRVAQAGPAGTLSSAGPTPEPAMGVVAATVVAGLVALVVAIAKGTGSWVGLPLAFLGAFCIPLAVIWTTHRIGTHGPQQATEPAARGSGEVGTADRAGSGDGLDAPVAGPVHEWQSAPRQLRVRPHGPRWWAGGGLAVWLVLSLLVIYYAPTAMPAAFAPVIVGVLSLLLLTSALLLFQVGITADEHEVTITNTLRQVSIPWSQLADIEFEALPPNPLGLTVYKLVFVTHEPRRFPAEAPTGVKDDETYLVDVWSALMSMRDRHRHVDPVAR
jgi:hypothetical protein